MKRIKNFIAISAFGLLVLGIPAIASAQYNGGYDPYNRNGGNNNGGYNNGNGNYGDMRSTVRNLKSRTRELQRQIDRELDRSRYNGSRREDQINEIADRFRDAVNHLDENGRQDQGEIRQVMDLSSQMDRSISRSGLSYNVQNLWSSIRNDLRSLGGNGYYDNNGRNNRNNRYPQGGTNNRITRPSWWPF